MKSLKKIILVATMTAIIPLALMGCVGKQEPKEVVTTFMDSLKQYNIAKPLTLMDSTEKDGDPKTSSTDLTKVNFQDETTNNFLKAMLTKLDYEIVSVDKDGSSAKIKAKISSVDLDAINKMIMQQMKTQGAATGKVETKTTNKEEAAKQMQKAITKVMESSEAPKKTTEVTIELSKVKGEWKVEPTKELMAIIFGDMKEKK